MGSGAAATSKLVTRCDRRQPALRECVATKGVCDGRLALVTGILAWSGRRSPNPDAPHRGYRMFSASGWTYTVHADVICLMAGNSAGPGARNSFPLFGGSRVLPDRFKISQLTAGLSWAPYRAAGELHRRHACGPHHWPPKPGSVHPFRLPADSVAGYPARDTRNRRKGQRTSVYSLRSSCTRLV
jgi:hypothetical protein